MSSDTLVFPIENQAQEIKPCGRCGRKFLIDTFELKKDGTPHALCDKCLVYVRDPQNKQRERSRKGAVSIATKESFLQFCCKIGFPTICNFCGEDLLDLMELHHLSRNEKEYQISDLLKDGKWTLAREKKIEVELRRCMALCCSCHKLTEDFLRNTQFTLSLQTIALIIRDMRRIPKAPELYTEDGTAKKSRYLRPKYLSVDGSVNLGL